ncbi:hypothetical protein AGMMS49525_00200 [Bacteroidia bacterium]|nr:hypothetical protein AGMMS49525_00200 [Bacteroidia bacterium]
MRNNVQKQKNMATTVKTKNEASTGHIESKSDVQKKSKFTAFWEKYPTGTTIVFDRRAILK